MTKTDDVTVEDVKERIARNEARDPNFYKAPTESEVEFNKTFQENYEYGGFTGITISRRISNRELADTVVEQGICLVCGYKDLPHIHTARDGISKTVITR